MLRFDPKGVVGNFLTIRKPLRHLGLALTLAVCWTTAA